MNIHDARYCKVKTSLLLINWTKIKDSYFIIFEIDEINIPTFLVFLIHLNIATFKTNDNNRCTRLISAEQLVIMKHIKQRMSAWTTVYVSEVTTTVVSSCYNTLPPVIHPWQINKHIHLTPVNSIGDVIRYLSIKNVPNSRLPGCAL